MEVTSDSLDERFGRPRNHTFSRSGVRIRRFSVAGQSQSELAALALIDAMKNANIKGDSIDLLISACGVQEQALPSTACAINAHAGLPKGTPSFDVNASCLSFLMAVKLAATLLSVGTYRRIAVVSADQPSRGIDWSEPEASLIFGDGAAAVILEPGNSNQGVQSFLFKTYPEGRSLCEIRAGGTLCNPARGASDRDYLFRMNGKKVMKLALQNMPAFMEELLASKGMSVETMDLIIPHQASHLGMAHMSKRIGVDPSRIVDIYSTHGNQVAASIPTALHEALASGRLQPGKRALLIGTAAGLSIGGMVMDF
ncbi:3-oxoacyl-[acyl-carrier-protein] synthase III C-terminal domain-containing protein [Noviherbaspirillum humi]|nr:3-oxoacyl-[acyl-carrier-protein] synthase III C-terminal domain-containing protein [Noviherbaspirillum humi]